MKNVSIIVAYDDNRLIGNGKSIPWCVPEDMSLFRTRTTGHSVIMGRKTYESIPAQFRPLPKRENIVVTSGEKKIHNNTIFVNSVEEAIEAASREQVFIIGGAQIYKYALEHNLVDRIIASAIKGEFKGNTYFPELTDWQVVAYTDFKDFALYEFTNAIAIANPTSNPISN